MNKYKGAIFISILSVGIAAAIYSILLLIPTRSVESRAAITPIITTTSSPIFSTRKMSEVRERSDDPLLNCYALADEEYFDNWSIKCEQFYEENKEKNYINCLSRATTTPNKSNYYREIRMIKRPSPQDCEILKTANVFPSNCILTDGRGKPDTLAWESALQLCVERYGQKK